ncbi:ensconsin-like isoform X2 [Limulus polyphemus]|nr:ensconsin-like isoform X2 [Limulus polyphemus]XP_022248627.1 ensconsin-like isoform X2 [Limulus polyphemus]
MERENIGLWSQATDLGGQDKSKLHQTNIETQRDTYWFAQDGKLLKPPSSRPHGRACSGKSETIQLSQSFYDNKRRSSFVAEEQMGRIWEVHQSVRESTNNINLDKPLIKTAKVPDVSSKEKFSSERIREAVGEAMSKSLNYLSNISRGRRKTDITPTVPSPWDRGRTPTNTPPGTRHTRAVSMSRIDHLTQTRRSPRDGVEESPEHSSSSSKEERAEIGLNSILKKPRSAARKIMPSSPSRLQGSIQSSKPAEMKQQTPVTLRPHSSPRQPRPYSIAGTRPAHGELSTNASTAGSTKVPRVKSAGTVGFVNGTKKSAAIRKIPLQTQKKFADDEKREKVVSSDLFEQQVEKVLEVSTTSKHDRELSFVEEPTVATFTPPSTPKPRIISEEEAKAILAEKRRQVREQAEREAELERQRLAEIRRQEEEKRQKVEEQQRRYEEEQLRLAQEHRHQEEEKLKKAILEKQKQEEEECKRKEEEEIQRIEKEEQERKAREEADKLQKELEERHRQEEAERAERKKRLEKIMSRTRSRSRGDSPNPPSRTSTPPLVGHKLVAGLPFVKRILGLGHETSDKVMSEKMKGHKTGEDCVESTGVTTAPTSQGVVQNGLSEHTDSNKEVPTSKKLEDSMLSIEKQKKDQINLLGNDIAKQDSKASDTETFEKDMEYGSFSDQKAQLTSDELPNYRMIDQNLANITSTTGANQNQVGNLLTNEDDVNQNRMPGNPLIQFEEKFPKKQEADLLS